MKSRERAPINRGRAGHLWLIGGRPLVYRGLVEVTGLEKYVYFLSLLLWFHIWYQVLYSFCLKNQTKIWLIEKQKNFDEVSKAKLFVVNLGEKSHNYENFNVIRTGLDLDHLEKKKL